MGPNTIFSTTQHLSRPTLIRHDHLPGTTTGQKTVVTDLWSHITSNDFYPKSLKYLLYSYHVTWEFFYTSRNLGLGSLSLTHPEPISDPQK